MLSLQRLLFQNSVRGQFGGGMRHFSLHTMQSRAKFRIEKEPNKAGMAESMTRFYWDNDKPRTVLIIKKDKDVVCTTWMETIAAHLVEQFNMRVLVEPQAVTKSPHIQTFSETEKQHLNKVVDFIITLGGDGSLLHVSSLFTRIPHDEPPPPPILSFHLGTLGVLMPFQIAEYKEAIAAMLHGGFACTPRMRLVGDIFRHDFVKTTTQHIAASEVLNEITIHRSTHPLATTIQCTVNGHTLATVIGDGLIVATATGSTAYSLWCGGPMVHPGISGILLTPISPRGIARPALLPEDAVIRLGIAPTGRATASVSFDGNNPTMHIDRGDIVRIYRASHPLYTVARSSPTEDWVKGNHKIIDHAETASAWITALSTV